MENAANLQTWVALGDILSSSSQRTVDGDGSEKSEAKSKSKSGKHKAKSKGTPLLDETNFKPTPVDPTVLLPSTFANLTMKRHVAHVDMLRCRREADLREDSKSSKLTAAVVKEAVDALCQLHTLSLIHI